MTQIHVVARIIPAREFVRAGALVFGPKDGLAHSVHLFHNQVQGIQALRKHNIPTHEFTRLREEVATGVYEGGAHLSEKIIKGMSAGVMGAWIERLARATTGERMHALHMVEATKREGLLFQLVPNAANINMFVLVKSDTEWHLYSCSSKEEAMSVARIQKDLLRGPELLQYCSAVSRSPLFASGMTDDVQPTVWRGSYAHLLGTAMALMIRSPDEMFGRLFVQAVRTTEIN